MTMLRRMLVTAALFALGAVAAYAGDLADGPAINYISADAVYVNVGSRAGLAVGAKVRVIREGKEVATLEVVYVSSNSASCRVLTQTAAPVVGDAILFDAAGATGKAAAATPPVEKAARPLPERRAGPGRVRGSVSIQNQYQRDLGETSFSSYQPGLNLRLAVHDVFGGGVLRIRHRTRFYRRSHPLGIESNTDEWAHLLTEFGVYFPVGDERDAIGFGRVLNPYIRGLGYMDGAYASTRLGPHVTVGAAGGLDPDLQDSSVRTNHSKYGVFVAYERGSFATRRIASTLAYSGSTAEGTINRDFAYIQNTLSFARRVSIYQSTEVDLNRGWRRDATGKSVSFSNTYVNANAQVTRWLGLDANYDARRNIRDFRTHDSPDSLFDDALSTGYGAGLTLSFPGNVRLRTNAGLRRRENEDGSTRYASASLNAARLPLRGHSASAAISISDAPYITGYRPVFTYRFPVTRHTRLSLGAGSYIYDQEVGRTHSNFGEVGVHQTLGNRYYLSGNLRRLGGDTLDSVLLYTEVGVSF